MTNFKRRSLRLSGLVLTVLILPLAVFGQDSEVVQLPPDGKEVQWAHATGVEGSKIKYDLKQPIAFKAPEGMKIVFLARTRDDMGRDAIHETGMNEVSDVHQYLRMIGDQSGRGLGGLSYMTLTGEDLPMELVLNVDRDAQFRLGEFEGRNQLTNEELLEIDLKLSLLQRLELSDRVRRYLLQVFGDDSIDKDRRVLGSVKSSDPTVSKKLYDRVFPLGRYRNISSELTVPLEALINTQEKGIQRVAANRELESNRNALFDQGYLEFERQVNNGEELWRVSLRLAALNNVEFNYGQFLGEIKTVVEPCLAAYRYRIRCLKKIHEAHGNEGHRQGKLLVIGPAPTVRAIDADHPIIGLDEMNEVNQTGIFVNTLNDLIQNSGFVSRRSSRGDRKYKWVDPDALEKAPSRDNWVKLISQYDCVLVIGEPNVDITLVRENATQLIIADDYQFEIGPVTKLPMRGMRTAAERKDEGDFESLVTSSYAGFVPTGEHAASTFSAIAARTRTTKPFKELPSISRREDGTEVHLVEGMQVPWAHTTGVKGSGIKYELERPIAFKAPEGMKIVLVTHTAGREDSTHYTDLNELSDVDEYLTMVGDRGDKGLAGLSYGTKDGRTDWSHRTSVYVATAVRPGRVVEQAKQTIGEFDTNGDGEIDTHDMNELEDRGREMFGRSDADKDGKITLDEVIEWIEPGSPKKR